MIVTVSLIVVFAVGMVVADVMERRRTRDVVSDLSRLPDDKAEEVRRRRRHRGD